MLWVNDVDSNHYYVNFHTAILRVLCRAKTEGLVRYPTTLAPVSGSVTVTTQCSVTVILLTMLTE